MRDRAAEILAATVKEFIETGMPVSSAHLYDRYDFGIKPASIRIELTDLTDAGYLEQPHHAAGRVPSDEGYAFFAERALEGATPGRSVRALEEALGASAWDDFAHALALELGAAAVVADLRDGYAWTRGISSLVEHLDWDSREELAEIIRDLEAVDQRIDAFRTRLGGTVPQVFIGKGNPLGTTALATLAAQYSFDGHPIAIIAVGPKRMDYARAARLFATVDHLITPDD